MPEADVNFSLTSSNYKELLTGNQKWDNGEPFIDSNQNSSITPQGTITNNNTSTTTITLSSTTDFDNIDSATNLGVSALQGDYVSSEAASGDSNEAIYITRKVALDNPATGIKVILDANRFASADIKLMFKILRSDDASDFDEIGYNFFNTDGSPDSVVNASLSATDFKEYEYTANNLDEFIAFSIKIVMQGTNTSEPPRLKDLRALALAT